MSNTLKLTSKNKATFLIALTESANVSSASKLINVSREYMYRVRKLEKNKEFAEAWDDALQVGVDTLEEEARRRAYLGVDEPVYYQGKQCGSIKRYSDTLIIFLLKAHRPEKYKDRRDVTTSDQPITVQIMEYGGG